VTELCRKHGISSATYYAWKAKFGGLEVSDAKRLRSLEEGNARLKRLLADTMLDNAGLKDLLLSCPLLSGPSTMTVWTKEGTTNACEEAQAGGDHRQAA
jgi:hypothetical protein